MKVQKSYIKSIIKEEILIVLKEKKINESLRDIFLGGMLATSGMASAEETPQKEPTEITMQQPKFNSIVVMNHRNLKNQDPKFGIINKFVNKIEKDTEKTTGKKVIMGTKELEKYFSNHLKDVKDIQAFINKNDIQHISEKLPDPIIIITDDGFDMAYQGEWIVGNGAKSDLLDPHKLFMDSMGVDIGGGKSYEMSKDLKDIPQIKKIPGYEVQPEKGYGFETDIKEGLLHHKKSKTPLTENIYRIGSTAYFKLIKEARTEYQNGNYIPLNEEEKELLESDLGDFAMFRGEMVPLDFPMWNETIDEAKEKKNPPLNKPMHNTGGGKKWKVYVRNPKTGGIKKVTYGDKKGGLKGNWNNAEARKSFAARHDCINKTDKTQAGYWACRAHKDFGKDVPGRFW